MPPGHCKISPKQEVAEITTEQGQAAATPLLHMRATQRRTLQACTVLKYTQKFNHKLAAVTRIGIRADGLTSLQHKQLDQSACQANHAA